MNQIIPHARLVHSPPDTRVNWRLYTPRMHLMHNNDAIDKEKHGYPSRRAKHVKNAARSANGSF